MFKRLLITLSAAAFLAGGMALPAQAAGPESGVQLAADSSHKKIRKQRTKGKVREAARPKPKGRVIRGAKPKGKGAASSGQPKGIVAQSDKPKPGNRNKILGPSD